ncbi:MAG: polyprenyl synthetase family protein [Bacteroidales bacterium]|jgi:geranylgeranyl diphosphate synthase type II|nr:polyprenyl synthetase family protein [Bacteroidales bacterium]
MVYSFEECSSIVEKQIEELHIGLSMPERLYEPVAYMLARGGKRIRPALTLMSCNLFDDNVQKALMPAVAVEVFHNFTLIHDDLMDNADVRRNSPTVHRKWSGNTAILSGDAMQTLAYRYLFRAPAKLLPALLDVFSGTALAVCEGQQYDMDFESDDSVTLEAYRRMIELKTAALIAASLHIGAICGGAGQQDIEALHRWGLALGMAFQIQDDRLDMYGDPAIFGKAVGGDILEEKKTYLLLMALQTADSATRADLLSLLHNRALPPEERIGRIKAIYDRLKINEKVKQVIDNYRIESIQLLQKVNLPDNSRKKALENLSAMLFERNK